VSTGPSPYRSETGPGKPEPPSPDVLEEHLLAIVLFVAGLIGVVIGAVSPRAHATELTLGAILAALGAWTFWRQRARAERRSPPRRERVAGPPSARHHPTTHAPPATTFVAGPSA